MGTDLIKAFLTAFLGACSGALAMYLIALPQRQKSAQEALYDRLAKTEEGVKSLLRSEIQKEYLKICDPDRKYAKPYEKQNVAKLYSAYHEMGGNSYVTELYGQIMQKPVEPHIQ